AIDRAAPGDTVQFGQGTYNLNGSVFVKTGRTLKGTTPAVINSDATLKTAAGTKIAMNLSTNDHGLVIDGNARDVTIDGLGLSSNRGVIAMTGGSAYNNVRIINNSIQGAGGKYMIFGTVTNNGLKIEHNYFHDSQDSLRNMEVWRMNDSSYSYNVFYNVEDGGHIMDPGPNVSFSFNYGRLIHRMGIEVQDSGFATRPDRRNFVAEGNVMFDWFQPYWDSMNLSIPITSPQGGSRIVNNYLKGNAWQGQWISQNNQTRGSYGIELGMEAVGECSGNIIGSERGVVGICVMEENIPVKNNKLYGPWAWGTIIGEPNSHGSHGTAVETNNLKDPNLANMPRADQVPFAVATMKNAGPGGGTVVGGSDPTGGGTAPSTAPANLSGKAVSQSQIDLTWQDKSADESAFRVERRPTQGTDGWVAATKVGAGVTSYSDKGLDASRQYSYRVVAITPTGEAVSSEISVQTLSAPSGSSLALPTDLTGKAISTTQIDLAWKDNASNETGYRLERKTTRGGDGFVKIADLPAGASSYSDKGLNLGWEYDYRVVAVNAAAQATSTQITVQTQTTEPSPTPSPATEYTYVSDLKWTSMKNGWGSAERNMSNGEIASGDGRTLTLNGRTYPRGLGVHAPSVITYQLDGKYSQFVSDVGVDDESQAEGSVIFQVWGDGVKLYDSGTMSGLTPTKTASVNVSGVMELKLVVASPTKNIDNDHADWAGARLYASSPQGIPVRPPASGGISIPQSVDTKTYLSDMNFNASANGYGVPERDMSNGGAYQGDGSTLTLSGVEYSKGIGVTSESKLVFPLAGKYRNFGSDIGIDDEVGAKGRANFQVWCDGELIHDSGLIKGETPTKRIRIPVEGVEQLWLIVTDAGGNGGGTRWNHADWAGAYVQA
ncbi:MAG: NPCBM/NEW2 domain-containing protein, partial [Tepidisphaeraceae bacterium]